MIRSGSIFSFVLACILLLVICVSGCAPPGQGPASKPPAITSQDAQQAAYDATVFGFPLVIMDISRKVMINVPAPAPQQAPINQFGPSRELIDASFTDVVMPNSDTLYDSAWVDTGKEPQILSLPDTGGRYYLMPMLNYWTDVYASPGTRTTGNTAGNYAITGPGWKGKLPDGIQEMKSQTRYVWIIGRIDCNGPSDYEDVWNIQDQVKLTPLSAWGTAYTPPATVPLDPTVDMNTPPLNQLLAMDAATYLDYFCRLMKDSPPYPEDAPAMAEFAKIGIRPGADFKSYFSGLDSSTQAAIQAGYKAAIAKIPDYPQGESKNGFFMTYGTGDYGTNYEFRAVIDYRGLGANLNADAFYANSLAMADGQAYSSDKNYVLHFDADQVPPVNGFWSLTLYNDKLLLNPNPLNRYKLGSTSDPALAANADGSIDLYIQRDSPGKDRENNWLPAPASGNFSLCLRLYWPKDQVLDKTWVPPAVNLVQ